MKDKDFNYTRVIKFKAKRLDNKEWVEGDLVHYNGNKVGIQYYSDIGENNYVQVVHEIDPSTVCQFTGLRDRSGVEIWEHDVLSNSFIYRGEVVFQDGGFLVKRKYINPTRCYFSELGHFLNKNKEQTVTVTNLGSKFDIYREEGEK